MPASLKPIAVVDIGSNSVRLVMYDGLRRAPHPIVNEKILCGLARGLREGGMLDKAAVAQTESAIARFVKLCELSSVKNLYLFATAAVRDAADGKDFVRRLEDRHGIKIDILSGEDEARAAAQGVASSVASASGVVGDLGGGSLELIGVQNGLADELCRSFPIGPLRLMTSCGQDRNAWQQAIDNALLQFPLREKLKDRTFYAVGGALRNLGRIHMVLHHYPLMVLDHYTVSTQSFLNSLRSLSRMSPAELEAIPGLPKRRVDILPLAAMVAERILLLGKPKEMMFSVYGVREGYLFNKLPVAERQKDPLLAGCYDMLARVPSSPIYGEENSAWMQPLFLYESKEAKRLRIASCLLSEISRYESTEYKAELAYRRVLDSSLVGLRHHERVFLARILFHRYRRELNEPLLRSMRNLVNAEAKHQAFLIGLALRLAYAISGAQPGVLPHTKLVLDDEYLTLTLDKTVAALAGESTEKRLGILAENLGRKAKLLVA
jgi:exopolyphosphatase/guanosine-5'-triphosphate,3'-diphosphate pyrophosphatase